MRSFLLSLACLALAAGHVHAQESESPPDDAVADIELSAEVDPDDPRGMAAMRRETLEDDAARALFSAASSLYEAGRFESAAQQFEAAYELSPRPYVAL